MKLMPPFNQHMLLILCLSLSTGLYSQELDVTLDWTLNLEDDGSGYGAEIVTDNEGDVFVIGSFNGTCYYNSDFVESNGQSDVLISKITEEGEILWVKGAGGSNGENGMSIDIMQNSSLFISGTFQDTAFFGNDTLIARGDRDLFLSKMDMDGNFLWSKAFGGDNLDVSIKLVVDDQYVYTTGGFRLTGHFGTDSLVSYGNKDIFVAKFDQDGDLIWLEQAGSDEYEYGNAIAKDQSGNIYVAAYFRDTCYFQTDTLIARGWSDLSIAKYDSDGNMLWVRHAGGTSYEIGNGLTVDNNNHVHLTGLFNDTLYVQGESLVSGGDQDIFFLSFDSEGTLIGSHSAGGNAEYENGVAAANDANNNLYYAGYHSDTSYFNGDMIVSYGEDDAFICAYNPSGDLIWLEHAGGRGYDEVADMTIHNNVLYAVGTFQDTLFIENDTLLSGGTYDMFIAKYTLWPIVVNKTMTTKTADFRIFPVPAKDYIRIETEQTQLSAPHVEILDIGGRLLLRESMQNETEIDISGLSEGSYIIRVIGDGKTQVSKFVKH